MAALTIHHIIDTIGHSKEEFLVIFRLKTILFLL